MSRVSFASLTPDPGERASGWVAVPGVDPPWEVPAFVVRGTEPGPTMVAAAGTHCAEYPGIEAVVELCRSTDPKQLRGTLIGLPLVNAPGFFERTVYLNPRDGKNVNRVFPGSADGTASERVARFLTDELITGADAFVDAHGGDVIEALVPFTLYAQTGNADVDATARELAGAYDLGFRLAVSPDSVPGAMYATAAMMGMPAVIAEVGQQGVFERASVERHLRGLRNMLIGLEMLDGPQDRRGTPEDLTGFDWLRTDIDATHHPVVAVGDRVEHDQVVGELRDIFGETIRVLRSPATGVITFLVTSLAVRAGDPLLGVGVA